MFVKIAIYDTFCMRTATPCFVSWRLSLILCYLFGIFSGVVYDTDYLEFSFTSVEKWWLSERRIEKLNHHYARACDDGRMLGDDVIRVCLCCNLWRGGRGHRSMHPLSQEIWIQSAVELRFVERNHTLPILEKSGGRVASRLYILTPRPSLKFHREPCNWREGGNLNLELRTR